MVQLGKKLQVQICKKNTIFVFNHKINKMSKELKITEVELKELQEQEQKKGAILHDLGLLEVQKHSLSHMYAELMVEQDKTKKELEDVYGKVNINLKDGFFEIINEQV